ncbi:Translation initiation factor eIF5A [Chondrus crispus]|uniref:Eukaryotic translation initiation factor 5A n=1 Tax=Chondrus crispus TaxID=2769 RepID=R7QK48_CHOCR|nr:Translation initiation factor eIF5A [Chondrus crispus]CDF38123.1 Translation initiation factor eIF5A [Chondrus crispus]|eukprot:XP_005717992.1 Translation initiation factor eIF5A [Chondrus crispus]
MSEHDSGSSGASNTVPVQAGALKKGSHVVIKGFPCKIIDYSTSKTGKHGHAKANIVGIDIFTGKKYEDISPSSHNMMSPVVTRKDFQLIDIDEEGYVTIMDDKNETRSDLRLDFENDDIHKKAKEDFEEGKDLLLTVLSALDTEKVIAVKELQ